MFYITHFVYPFLCQNCTPTPKFVTSPKALCLESIPSTILADTLLHLHSGMQHKSISLQDIVSTTSLDLPLNVPTFRLAILNVFVCFCLFCGISNIDDLVGLQPFKPTIL